MVISAKNLTKSYKIKPLNKIFGGFFSIKKTLYALKDISFDVEKGECVGIIGKNGSGKSTLLKLLCNITAPTSGSFNVNGRVSALLELGTGFNPEYNGISNIYLYGILNGLSKKETKALIPDIIEFSELKEYIKNPIKTYSDGMFLRLAFSCAVAIKPDILVIDEALAVGDFRFRQKCFSKIEELKKSGTTILLVSHDIDTIRRFCTRCIWLEEGKLIADGEVKEVSEKYMECISGPADFGTPQSTNNAFGSALGSIKSVTIPNLIKTGERIKITCEIDIKEGTDLENLALSISFKNQFGLDTTVLSTADYEISFKSSGRQNVTFDFECLLCSGHYSLSVSLEDRKTKPIKYYEYINIAAETDVVADKEYFGTFHTDANVEISSHVHKPNYEL